MTAAHHWYERAKETANLGLQCMSLNPKDEPGMPTVIQTSEGLQYPESLVANGQHHRNLSSSMSFAKGRREPREARMYSKESSCCNQEKIITEQVLNKSSGCAEKQTRENHWTCFIDNIDYKRMCSNFCKVRMMLDIEILHTRFSQQLGLLTSIQRSGFSHNSNVETKFEAGFIMMMKQL
ncbi:hypothetical protein Vadar_032655 [Vaccinium darrowii]|uniref:Uncharacterized protein n=1 Tax=Vaccinium darrowii TaxID=229202 RepID=A0ACB7Z875_9ERIC|nr:hypothetical protein Vadar_032655 [Vaccinium darrowii]